MISFEILGEVTAREGAWTAGLSRQQQHLLAALVLGKGAPISKERLEEILWDFRTPYPEKGIARVAHEVRAKLQPTSPGTIPLLSRHGGYCLPITPEQADVLRFRARTAEARRTSGPASAELMRQALREWGPSSVGLHGGSPLDGLPGQWADSTRHLLRTEHRDAVIGCLAHDMSRHDYGPVLTECEQRAADDPQALLDEEFVELWILSAAHAGDLARAHIIYQRARHAAESTGAGFSQTLHQLEDKISGSATAFGAVSVTASSRPIPVTTDQGPIMEQTAGENVAGPPEPGQPADRQPGNVVNGDVYLNIAPARPASDTGKVQAQVIVARDQGNAFGALGGNIYHYQGIPQNLPPQPGTSSVDSPEERTESS